MAEPAIVFDGVWKKFRRGEHHDSLRDLIPALAGRVGRVKPALDSDEFWVLRDVSFEARPGDVLGIIGANGAGKSTALKLLTRILRPTRGTARVVGRVGALIELAAGFHQDLTGRENIFLQGAIMGMRRHEVRERFDDIVSFAGLSDFIDTQVKRYSSGMNARLGFAIAAHLDPEVLLIDEVLAVGDFSFQQRCYDRLEHFRRQGIPIAFVSHNMQAIATLCNKAVLLRAGAEPVVGAVPEVLSAYTASKGLTADPRVHVLSVALRRRGENEDLSGPIRPADELELHVVLRAEEELVRCGLLIQVMRGDGLVTFTGMSTLDGGEEFNLRAGDKVSATITFVANVLRGTYSINLQLVDAMRQWKEVVVSGVSSFVVSETTRIAGCAELAPKYEVEVQPANARATA